MTQPLDPFKLVFDGLGGGLFSEALRGFDEGEETVDQGLIDGALAAYLYSAAGPVATRRRRRDEALLLFGLPQ